MSSIELAGAIQYLTIEGCLNTIAGVSRFARPVQVEWRSFRYVRDSGGEFRGRIVWVGYP